MTMPDPKVCASACQPCSHVRPRRIIIVRHRQADAETRCLYVFSSSICIFTSPRALRLPFLDISPPSTGVRVLNGLPPRRPP